MIESHVKNELIKYKLIDGSEANTVKLSIQQSD